MSTLQYQFRADLYPVAAVVLDDAVAFDLQLDDSGVRASAARLGIDLSRLVVLDLTQVADAAQGG